MLALESPAASYTGIVAFYSVIHLPHSSLPDALAEFRRVLIVGGLLLLSFHIGSEIRHPDEWLERRVSLDFHFFEVADVQAALVNAGFSITAVVERQAIPDVEVETPPSLPALHARPMIM